MRDDDEEAACGCLLGCLFWAFVLIPAFLILMVATLCICRAIWRYGT